MIFVRFTFRIKLIKKSTMKFNYLFKILSAFLILSSFYSCSVDEEDTNNEFSFTIDGVSYSTSDYTVTNDNDGLRMIGRFGADSLVFNLTATDLQPVVIGGYDFTGNNFYAAYHFKENVLGAATVGTINLTEVSKRISGNFEMVMTPVSGPSYLIENGVLKNLLVTHPLNNPDVDPLDPNAPFNITYITDLDNGISANVNIFPYTAPIADCAGTKVNETITFTGTDGNGNEIRIEIYDIADTFVGKTYNASKTLDLAQNSATIYYKDADSEYLSSSGKVYVKSIDEANSAIIAFKCLLQDVNEATNVFVMDEGAVKNVTIVE